MTQASGTKFDEFGVSPEVVARMKKRRSAERRFRLYGRFAVIFSVCALAWLLISILTTGLSAFTQHWIIFDVETEIWSDADKSDRQKITLALGQRLGAAEGRESGSELLQIVSTSAARQQLTRSQEQGANLQEPLIISVPVSDLSDQYLKGFIDRDSPESERKISDQQIRWIERLREEGAIQKRFNRALFLNPDSRDPERAGLATSIFGSIMILLIASGLALPVGVGAAIYLDSFAPQTGWGGRLTQFLEVNINNLAAVPSIVFGLLGLAIFINFLGLPRSIPVVGGLVLALRMFPVIVIASRAALQAVPASLTDSALSLGASRMQAVFNHRVPLAAPGILTGSIIGMAQALGETAPLLMIGMVAFVTTAPASPMDPATALPVQIFLWSGSAEAAWAERTSAAIIILLIILMLINALAIILRERLQRARKL